MSLLSNFIKTGKDHIGIDIGSNSVRAVELIQEKEAFKISGVGYSKIKKRERKESIIAAINEAVLMAKIPQNKDVNIAISSPSIVIRFLDFPRMTEDELKNAIPFEAEKYIPLSVNEVMLDHQVLIPSIGNNKMLVLLIAAKKDIIKERLSLVKEAGLQVNVIDVAQLANVNTFSIMPNRNTNEVAALINIGAKSTDVAVITGGTLYFTRSIQIGGDDIAKLSVDPAQQMQVTDSKAKAIVGAITDEIRLSFSYCENQSGRNIDSVYVSGGCVNIPDFLKVFNESLGFESIPWDALKYMAINPSIDAAILESVKHQMGTAIGLALR